MVVEIGLVGCPSSGKSTFFKALTLKDVKIAPYPFTTIEPNEGLGFVRARCPCKELNLAGKCKQCIDGTRFVPVKLWDVAGLVPDAHLGRGRGVAFLDDLMQASALIHIVDVSGTTDSEGNPSKGFDPSETVDMLKREIDFWLLGIFKKDWRTYLQKKECDQIFCKRFAGLGIDDTHLKQAMAKSRFDFNKLEQYSEDELVDFMDKIRQQSKPMIVAANKYDVPGSEENLRKLRDAMEEPSDAVPASAEMELALKEAATHGLVDYLSGSPNFSVRLESILTEKQKTGLGMVKHYLERNKSTGVQQCLEKAVFELLDMIVVYPVEDEMHFSRKDGTILPDALLVKNGTTAHELAYKIHKDIGDKFIAAINARTKQHVSADYKLKNGDIISIKAGR